MHVCAKSVKKKKEDESAIKVHVMDVHEYLISTALYHTCF